MIDIKIPGRSQSCCIHHLLLDLNGTLAKDGMLLHGIGERIALLREQLEIVLLTADTMGTGEVIGNELGIRVIAVHPDHGGEDKYDFMLGLEPTHTAAIGNGYNDMLMLRYAALGIAVIGPEGCAAAALREADIVVKDIRDGLDLLINPLRIVATLRP